jgi:pimeloyl-ACP methyl ester carboxylesterase
MDYRVIEEQRFKYIEVGNGEVLLLLHGLFGALSNFEHIVRDFSPTHRIVVPLLPIFELPTDELSVMSLMEHVRDFVEYKDLRDVHVLGNSLGGHIALLYALHHPERIRTLTLTGSSGLFENAMGTSFPKRGDYEFMKQRAEMTFYDPKFATKELVDEVFGIVNDREKAFRIILTAKSAIRHNLETDLKDIHVRTLLIWGKQDSITPPFVGEEFGKKMPNAELHLIDLCGHAPMMEQPGEFNRILREFLEKNRVQ